MKKILYFILSAGLMVSACVDSLTPVQQVEQPAVLGKSRVQMIAPPILYDDATKATMTVGETGLSFKWATGDKAKVYSEDESTGDFSLASGEGTSTATFTGFDLINGKKYYAFTPSDGTIYTKTAIPLNYASQTFTGDNDIVSPMTRDYMWAQATPESGNASFSFSHISSFVRVQMSGLTENDPVTKVQLIPMYGDIAETATFDITTQDTTWTNTTKSRDITSTTATVPAGGISTVWAMMAPQDFSTGNNAFAVAATVNDKLYTARLNGGNLVAGKAYKWNVEPKLPTELDDEDLNLTLYLIDSKDQVKMTPPATWFGNYSGITYIGKESEKHKFAVVDDKENGGGIVFFKIPIDEAYGDITASGIEKSIPEGTSGSAVTGKDNEDVVLVDGALWVAAEGDQSIQKYNASTGAALGESFSIPADMGTSRITSNAGFEALTYNATTGKYWTTTELPLTADTFLPRLHRLQRFDSSHNPDARYLYQMDEPTPEAAADPNPKAYAFGIPAMVALPDGRLIILEREVYVPDFPSTLADLDDEIIQKLKDKTFAKVKLYVVDPVHDKAGVLRKKLFTQFQTGIEAMSKTPPEFSASFANYEGMCLGPVLADGKITLILIADAQGGMPVTAGTPPLLYSYPVISEWIKVITFLYTLPSI